MSKVGVVRVERSRMEALIDRLGHEDTPRVYTDRNVLVRELFWRRLSSLLALSEAPTRERALDFGGGNGVLAPTLARLYDEVVCVDLRTEMAEELLRKDGVTNVTVRAGELRSLALPADSFDTITAADVLEHIVDLELLVAELRRLLKPGGELLVSAPSENRFYELGRRVFGYTKPDDHYHSAMFIEDVVSRQLPLARRRYFPFNTPPLAVFELARFVKEPS
ncbi:MAG: class I SAM-dependent methyltransferase [Dehalococcoidia bacterium]